MAEHLSTPEAAQYLNLAKRTLERWRLIDAGPPWRKFGRRVVYNRDILEKWAEKQGRDPEQAGKS